MAGITFDQVSKQYVGGHLAVSELDLAIGDGEFMVLVGPSGCGKSTALRLAAGLEDATMGRILIGEEVVNGRAPRDRDIAMVFQSYALYPHLSVAENMGFGLRVRGMSKAERHEKVVQAAKMLQLGALLDRKPSQLSGGQRQRVAMGRAIVRQPKAFLMDEPLSNLDAKLRVQMRTEITRIQHATGITALYVTHDQIEAMTMGDRVAVMRDGRLQQLADPETLYNHPVNVFVASFIGSPAMNLVAGRLDGGNGRSIVRLGTAELPLPPALLARHASLGEWRDRPVVVGIRPEALQSPTMRPSHGVWAPIEVNVNAIEVVGSAVLVHFTIDGLETQRPADGAETAETGAARPDLLAALDPLARPARNSRVTLTVDTERLHLFDPSSGESLAA